jgi:8-oxo-dGTP diphosphatase
MNVRSTIKAIVLDQGKILLIHCRDEHNGEYYSLPGGGQNVYESMHDALVRECLEETGYTVEPVRFAAICEEICDDPYVREVYPQYAHKLLHIFVCRLTSAGITTPVETDEAQIAAEWVSLETLPGCRLLPLAVGNNILRLIEDDTPLNLGSTHIPFNHG